jgi:EpsI family protein
MSTIDHPALSDAPAFPRAIPGQGMARTVVWLYAGLGGILLILLCAPVFTALWDLWTTRQDYSHGCLVPLISLYLVRMKWGELQRLPIRPVLLLGVGMLLPSLAGVLIGVAGGIITVSSVSVIGLLAALILLLFGHRMLQAAAFPLAYLIFMTPFLDVVVEPLHQPLQRMSATVVGAWFQRAGVPIYLEGTSIQFPNGILEVAVQCSGAGFLISALAIGVPLAALALRSWWSRGTLIVIALLMSIVANWMRIGLVGMIGYASGWGPQVHGPFHILQGMLVYWVGLGVLFAGTWILVQVERKQMKPAPHPVMVLASSTSVPAWPQWRRAWRLALLLLAGATVWLYGYDAGPVAAKQTLASLPSTVGEWGAREAEPADPVMRIPGADDELIRVYRRGGGGVRLYVAYLSSQGQGKELVNYLTAPLHQEAAQATVQTGGRSLAVNIGVWTEHRIKTPILFWYVVDGRIISDRYEAKAASIAQALTRRGSNGALVLIGGDPGEDRERAVAEMKQFMQDLIPVLQPALP